MTTRNAHPDDFAFARLTVTAAALEFGQPDLSLDIEKRGKGAKDSIFVRQVAMYLLQTVFDLSLARTAEVFGRHYSTISHALRVVEESRDDAVFNRKLMKTEDFLSESLTTFRAAA